MKVNSQLELRILSTIIYLSIFILTLPANDMIDTKKIAQMEDEIKRNNYDIHSILISKDNYLLYEKYFKPFTKDTMHITYHIMNSIVSCCIGICIDENIIANVDEKIISYFPEYLESIKDKRQNEIAIKHLLTMTGGYTWSSEHNDDPIREFENNSNLTKYMFSLDLLNDPGVTRNQNSGSIYLLIKIIEKVSGRTIEQFIREKLFSPLGITEYKIERDQLGATKGPYALYMLPSDLLKLGKLFLNNGIWNGQQIISKKWITETLSIHWSLSQTRFRIFNELGITGFGYFWTVYKDFFAIQAHNGQHIYIYPKKNEIIVFTAKGYTTTPCLLLRDYINVALK